MIATLANGLSERFCCLPSASQSDLLLALFIYLGFFIIYYSFFHFKCYLFIVFMMRIDKENVACVKTRPVEELAFLKLNSLLSTK